MKILAKIEKEFIVAAIKIRAEVRYWDDAKVNEQEDTSGTLIPLRNGANWAPIIDLQTGKVRDWPAGTKASIHYKVCDAGEYELLGVNGSVVATREGYVPDILCPEENGYGDYIIMNIGADGVIAGWAPEIDPDDWAWESP